MQTLAPNLPTVDKANVVDGDSGKSMVAFINPNFIKPRWYVKNGT